MAKLTVNKPKPVKHPPSTYTLTLNEREAQVIHWLTGSIYGMSDDRNTADRVWKLLDKAGIESDDVNFYFEGNSIQSKD